MKATKPVLSANQFPVVGIGASAGGLDAFKKLLKAIPENSGMAYVLVQHLDPHHESALPDLLQKVTKIPVLEISDDIKVEPDHIYVIPSNKMMIANDGVLQLTPRPTLVKSNRNLPIDLFFTSLAEVHQTHAIGVVLSGTANDGTAGLKAIKEYGGITFAQDEGSAAYDSMPNSAVKAGVVDFVLPPEQIPGKILEVNNSMDSDPDDDEQSHQDNDVYRRIISLLRLRKGTDFTYYKQTTIRRRILRRMVLNKNAEPLEYFKFLRDNKTELNVLYQDMLIPVTDFFRDIQSFDALCKTVFPDIIQNTIPGEPVRIWVAGCSTGQEAYSIAMCFRELLGNRKDKVQIFATDLSETAIAKARSGLYTAAELERIPEERLNRFFTKTKTGFVVNKEVRDHCTFAVHNFIKDPPFGKVDFISCRNVLIYMEPYLQKKALTTFHYSLNPKGILFLGKTETTYNVPNLFDPIDKNEKIFSRKATQGRFMQITSQNSERNMSATDTNQMKEIIRTDYQKIADDIILNKYTPAGVIVNEAMEIVNFRGNTSNYLAQAAGKPSHNLLKMAKAGLGFELRNLIHKSKKEESTIVKKNILWELNGQPIRITIEVVPLPNTIEPYYLVLFQQTHTELQLAELPVKGKKALSGILIDTGALRIKQLEQELVQTHEDMRSITEDQEAINAELQNDNEELLSSSEELQSMNEELETSKEELQSTNEELMVVNQEIAALNEQLTDAKNYSEAIVSTVREPLLILDKNLRVKTANSSYYRSFRVNEFETEGRLIYEVDNKQWDIPALRKLLENILPEKTAFKDFEITHTFFGMGERTMLLNAREIQKDHGSEKLILLAIEDITEQKMHQQKESELLSRFQDLVVQAPVAICILKGNDYTVELANEFYLQVVERGQEMMNKRYFDSLPELENQGIHEMLEKVMTTGVPFHGDEVELYILKNKSRKQGFYNFVYQPILDIQKKTTGIIIVVTEVTDQVIARKRMEVQATMVQNLMMTAPGFVSTLDGPDHVYGMVNDRYQELFGKRSIKGKPILKALPELVGQGFVEILDKVYTTGEPYIGIDIPLTLARDENLEPELRYFNFSYQPIYDENKIIYSILVFGYEVTDQMMARMKITEFQQKYEKELEGEVKQQTFDLSKANNSLLDKNEELVKMNKELESFTYVSSHDMQEPLRKIQTFASRILDKEYLTLSDSAKDYFNRIQSSAARMQRLIEDLLAFSRINMAERKFDHTDLNDILEEVKSDLSEVIEEKKAFIEAGVLGKADVIPFQFRQLLYNLISNALKFSKPDLPPHIRITNVVEKGIALNPINTELPEGKAAIDKTYYHLTISDNGIGFEPQYSKRIFEVFQKLHPKEEYGGTGIGLAIVKRIVENHNGVIQARGAFNKGTIFDIYIPVYIAVN